MKKITVMILVVVGMLGYARADEEVDSLCERAEKGDAVAQQKLGARYYVGNGVKQDDGQAVWWWRRAAVQGDASAQTCLGYCYERGRGVSVDAQEAVKWYRKAAEQGLPEAQYNLASCYEVGKGVSSNAHEAAHWCMKAAEQGYAKAQRTIGVYYAIGFGVEVDQKESAKWMLAAAKQGESKACFVLSEMYANGVGVDTNLSEAVKWCRQAAERGFPKAQFELGAYYALGRGVEKSEKVGMLWMLKAAENGYEPAADFLKRNKESLEAEREVAERSDFPPMMGALLGLLVFVMGGVFVFRLIGSVFSLFGRKSGYVCTCCGATMRRPKKKSGMRWWMTGLLFVLFVGSLCAVSIDKALWPLPWVVLILDSFVYYKTLKKNCCRKCGGVACVIPNR